MYGAILQGFPIPCIPSKRFRRRGALPAHVHLLPSLKRACQSLGTARSTRTVRVTLCARLPALFPRVGWLGKNGWMRRVGRRRVFDNRTPGLPPLWMRRGTRYSFTEQAIQAHCYSHRRLITACATGKKKKRVVNSWYTMRQSDQIGLYRRYVGFEPPEEYVERAPP